MQGASLMPSRMDGYDVAVLVGWGQPAHTYIHFHPAVQQRSTQRIHSPIPAPGLEKDKTRLAHFLLSLNPLYYGSRNDAVSSISSAGP